MSIDVDLRRVRRFNKEVSAERLAARERWLPITNGVYEPVTSLDVLLEELGKVARARNKLALSSHPDTDALWRKELRRRLVTTGAMLERYALDSDAL